jgi:hypothetical protein
MVITKTFFMRGMIIINTEQSKMRCKIRIILDLCKPFNNYFLHKGVKTLNNTTFDT